MANLGYKTLSQMLDDVGVAVQDTSIANRRRVKDNINLAYDEIVAEYDWNELQRFDSLGLRKASSSSVKTLESGEADFPGPWDAANVLAITLNSPSASVLERVTPTELAKWAGSHLDATGVPSIFAEIGRTAQYQRLPADSTLTFKSDSTGNDAVRNIRVTYKTSSSHVGRLATEDLLGGTWGVAPFVTTQGTALAGWPVESIQIPKDWVGSLTADNNVDFPVVEIPPFEGGGTASEQWQILSRPLYRVWPVPSQDWGGTITWERRPPSLLENDDAPEIPVSTVLVYKAIAKHLLDDGQMDTSFAYERKAELALRRIIGSSNNIRRGAQPRGGSITGMTGIYRRSAYPSANNFI